MDEINSSLPKEANLALKQFIVPDNYVYLYHLPNSAGGKGVYLMIPTYPDQVSDVMSVNFSQATPLVRSAPIYSYQNSGPRSAQFTLKLHRELMVQLNEGKSNAIVSNQGINHSFDDYIDVLIKYIQTAAVPTYGASSKMVDPPMIAVRMGKDIFIKGVVSGSVSVTYGLPILSDGRYAVVDIQFTVQEVDPFDSVTVAKMGSYRGLPTTLQRNLWVRQ